MKPTGINQSITSASKPRYELLDGLRGVAALMVICYHVFEGFATSPVDQKFNHGYLAVDFFFMLSGFVIGYAYDDRWQSMGTGEFFKRRLIRLHPMVLMGVLIGVVAFVIQGCTQWDGTKVALTAVGGAMLLNVFMIPAVPGSSFEIRGNGEMFPVNGPHWSLFFEYIGNVLYALVMRRMPDKVLFAFTALLGVLLGTAALGDISGFYNLGVGWTLAGHNFAGGMLRMLFSFSMGLCMARVFRPVKVRGAFWICALAVMVLLSIPYAGTADMPWLNALYDVACIILVFPVLVWLGASGTTTDRRSSGICRFLGDISYPVYAVHYPLMYLFYAWVWGEGLAFADAWPVAVAVAVGSIVLAWLSLKFYDEPVRRRLARRFLYNRRQAAEAAA